MSVSTSETDHLYFLNVVMLSTFKEGDIWTLNVQRRGYLDIKMVKDLKLQNEGFKIT